MSRQVTEVHNITVDHFTGPVGRRESYQLTGPYGYVQLTYDEIRQVLERIQLDRDSRRATGQEP